MARNYPPTREEMWAPLEALAARVVGQVDVPLVLPCDFTFVSYVDQPRLPRIFAYQHKHSRHQVFLTAGGRLARYIPPRDFDDPDDLGRLVITRAPVRKVLGAAELEEWTDWTQGDGYCDNCVLLMEHRLSAELSWAV